MPLRLVDEHMRFEVFPNGHCTFLTRSALQKVLQGMQSARDRWSFEPATVAVGSVTATTIPEPVEDYGSGKRIVTLRLRALPGHTIPELFEGDFIAANGSGGAVHRQFRILDIHWGTKSYVNLLVDGAAARRGRRSTSDRNAYAVCEVTLDAETL